MIIYKWPLSYFLSQLCPSLSLSFKKNAKLHNSYFIVYLHIAYIYCILQLSYIFWNIENDDHICYWRVCFTILHDYNHTISTYFHHVFISLLQGVSSTVPRVCLGRTLSTSKWFWRISNIITNVILAAKTTVNSRGNGMGED